MNNASINTDTDTETDTATKTNIAIILAAGKGLRAGFDLPKQFVVVNGKTVLEHAVAPFEASPSVHEIYIVASEEYFQTIREMVSRNGFRKVIDVVAGGAERFLSTLAALDAIANNKTSDELDRCNVIIHDSARMLVCVDIIEQCISHLASYQAVTTGNRVADTIAIARKQANDATNDANDDANDDAYIIDAIPSRSSLLAVQTPQCFHLQTLRQGYRIAMDDPNLSVTDDCGIIKTYMPQIPILVATTQLPNHKLTTPNDLLVIKTIL